MTMDCRDALNRIPAYRTGDLEPAELETVGAHLANCPSCRDDAHDAESRLALLKSIDDIDPDPAAWTRLETAIRRDLVAPRRASAPFRGLLRFAAAASIALAVFSFIFAVQATRHGLAATIAVVGPGDGVEPGRRILPGETFLAPAYLVLALPEVGTLKVQKGTELVFDSPRRLRISRGEVFAEILPSGKGFSVLCSDATVTVHGTRFGVRSDAGPASVYVVEGRVDVAAGSGTTKLQAREMLVVGGPAKPLEDEALRWIAAAEAPSVELAGRLLNPAPARGEPPDLEILFRTNSAAPVLLPPVDDLLAQIHVRVTDPAGKTYLARLSAPLLRRSDLRTRGANGPVRLDVSTPAVLAVRLDPALLPVAGRYRLTLRYEPAPSAGGELFPRPLDSEPLNLEVR